jgi:hypothetical protein
MFYVFELTYPGTWLDYPDRDWAWRIEGHLKSLERRLAEATVSLSLFESERSRPHRGMDHDVWEQESERRRQIMEALEHSGSRCDPSDPSSWERRHAEVEVLFRREQWSRGQLPDTYEHALPFIYARSFLFALDGIDKFLGVLVQEPSLPPGVEMARQRFIGSFPQLREVRNSTAHAEDRTRGLGRGGKPLQLHPVTNPMVHAPGGGVLIVESLNGNCFGSTMADGHYGEVEVSAGSVAEARDCIQQVIDAFRWRGRPQHAPR